MAAFFRGAPAQQVKRPTRNPILQSDVQQEPFRPIRMRVAYRCNVPQSRPQGIANGTFSLKSRGSLSLADDSPAEYRTPRRLIEPEKPAPTLRKAPARTPPPRNPITQEDVQLTPVHTRSSTTLSWRPSESSESLGNKRYLLASEQHPEKTRNSNTLRSSVFEQSPPLPPRPRLTMEKPSQAGSLLQYKFAPAFRSDNVSPKPEQQPRHPQDFQDFQVHRSRAELYRIRSSQSTVTF